MAFMTFFLMPAFAEVGPEAGKFMAALQKRRVPVVLPIIALLAIVSGLWLFQRLSGGQPGALMATPTGMAFGLGGLAAILTFLIGIIVGRAAMMRNMKLAESLPKAAPDQRAAVMAEMKRLQARGRGGAAGGEGADAVRARRDGGRQVPVRLTASSDWMRDTL